MPRSVPPLRNQDGWSRPQIYYLQARPPLAKVTKLQKLVGCERDQNYVILIIFGWWFAWMSYRCLLGEENRQPFLCLCLLQKTL